MTSFGDIQSIEPDIEVERNGVLPESEADLEHVNSSTVRALGSFHNKFSDKAVSFVA